MSTRFTARYPGTCASCDQPFKAGTEVVYTIDDELAHAKCPPKLEPCPRCFLVPSASGLCGCDE